MTEKSSSSTVDIGRVAVLGAGTMGAQIAAYLADRGVPSDLLDLRSEGDSPSLLAEQAKERLKDRRRGDGLLRRSPPPAGPRPPRRPGGPGDAAPGSGAQRHPSRRPKAGPPHRRQHRSRGRR